MLLSWYYDQSRLLCISAAVALSVWRLGKWPGDPNIAKLAAFLLPVNFVLFAAFKERGVLSIDGFLKVALIATQVVGVVWFADHNVRRGLSPPRRSAGRLVVAAARGGGVVRRRDCSRCSRWCSCAARRSSRVCSGR